MKKRSCALGILFTLLTCGIYGIYWFCCLTNDTNALAKSKTAGGFTAFLFAVVSLSVYSLYWFYKLGVKVDEMENAGGSSGVLYLVLALFGFGIIAFLIAQSRVNQTLTRTGRA